MDKFAERLRRLRETHRPKSNIEAAAGMIGIHPNSLRLYERGAVTPSVEALEKIADHYGVSADYLMGRTDFPFVKKL